MRHVPPWLREARGLLRLGLGLARGTLAARRRRIDPTRPETWEFRGLSQSGEDGIAEYLAGRILAPDRFFVEIGSGFGIDGNVAWLAVRRRWPGLMVEADPGRLAISRILLGHAAPAVRFLGRRVTADDAAALALLLPDPRPDLVSIDVDGIDLYLAEALLACGVRPKVLAVEYNSAFGPEAAVSVPYLPELDFRAADPSGLYYGVSIAAWRRALGRRGYRFVAVESSGVNAFFLDPEAFEPAFVAALAGLQFRENRFQFAHFGAGFREQFARIGHLPLAAVD